MRRILGALLLVLCLSHHATAFLVSPAIGLRPRAATSQKHARASRAALLSPRMASGPTPKDNKGRLALPALTQLPELRLPGLSNKVKASFLTLLAMCTLVLGSPLEALAAKSGGRVGGGSFSRSAPSSRSYSAPSRTYAPSPSAGQSIGGGSTVVIQRPLIGVSPFYSPFGFSPFGFGYGLAPYSAPGAVMAGPSLGNIILLGGMAYVAYQIVSARPSDGMTGFVDDVSVSKVQVAVYCPERGPSSLLGTISRLADRCDTDDQDSISSLVSDVALALLRREGDWISTKVESFGVKSEGDAEDKFSQFSLKERAKIERETFNRVRGRDKSDAREREGGIADIGKPTVAVVTLILAMQGKKVPEAKDVASLRKLLSSIGSDVVGSDSLMAAEVMWTPEEPWENVTPDDVVLDYPDLIPL